MPSGPSLFPSQICPFFYWIPFVKRSVDIHCGMDNRAVVTIPKEVTGIRLDFHDATNWSYWKKIYTYYFSESWKLLRILRIHVWNITFSITVIDRIFPDFVVLMKWKHKLRRQFLHNDLGNRQLKPLLEKREEMTDMEEV